MPGKYDLSRPHADFMTPFVLHRTVAATDPNLNFTESLELSDSPSASQNELHIIIKQTVGAPARLKLEFYAQLPHQSAPVGLQNTWFLMDKTTFLSPLELNRYDNFMAGTYKVKAILEAGGTFEIYVSTSHNHLNPATL